MFANYHKFTFYLDIIVQRIITWLNDLNSQNQY